ncbi:MAG: hypothetical protein JWR45_3421 [Blastococcus sp.]|nr:hypothetical protein [Blastococcus sp.]
MVLAQVDRQRIERRSDRPAQMQTMTDTEAPRGNGALRWAELITSSSSCVRRPAESDGRSLPSGGRPDMAAPPAWSGRTGARSKWNLAAERRFVLVVLLTVQ